MASHSLLLLLLTAVNAGISGSMHCFSMCGGIGTTLGLNSSKKRYVFSYHLGRIISYTALGLILGNILPILGIHSEITDWQIPLRRFSALIIILIGFVMIFDLKPFNLLEKYINKIWQPLAKKVQNFLPIKYHSDALIIGMIWGLLPCGLIYSTLLLAITSGHSLYSGLIMFVFGITTMPSMLIITLFAHKSRIFLHNKLIKIILGIITIGLGISGLYHSQTHNHNNHQQQTPQEIHNYHHHH